MQGKLRNFYDNFGERIAFLREKRGLTLGQLADGAASTAKSWEEGSLPRPDQWEAIAKRLQMSVTFVFLGKPTSREDYDFIAKYADEIGRPERVVMTIDEPETLLHPGAASPKVGEEEQASYGGPELLRQEIDRHYGALLAAAGSDTGKLGWIREQLRRHIAIPEHWDADFSRQVTTAISRAHRARPQSGKAGASEGSH